MKTQYLTMIFTFMFLFYSGINAQKEKTVNEKLKNIKSDISKITVTTEEGDIVFEGDEAKDLFKRMNSDIMIKYLKSVSNDDKVLEFEGDHHLITSLDDDLVFASGDENIKFLKGNKIIKITVDDENGEKKVTVKTIDDGKEDVKVYEGEEAEKYLEEHKSDDDYTFKIESDDDGLKKHKKIWIQKDGSGDEIKKEIKVELKDDGKKVTVTTTENGEEKVETYEGKEAEEYLEKMEREDDGVEIIKKKKIIIKERDKSKDKEEK